MSRKARQLRAATYAAVATAALLVALKFAAWLWTGSVSMLASLIDSLMDIIASALNLIAVRFSLMPADREHRFGHGKAEPLAGLAQATFIGGSATFLVFHAIERLRSPRALEEQWVGIAVMVVAIALTLLLLAIQRRVIRETQSTAIKADALHYGTDVLTNLTVIVALILADLGWYWADPVLALGVAGYIFYSAARIGYEAVQHLMDRELGAETQQQILRIARSKPEVRGVHDLRTRQSGQMKFIQLHVELDGDLSLERAHAVAEAIEQEIVTLVPDAEVIIHQDPADVREHLGRELWPPAPHDR